MAGFPARDWQLTVNDSVFAPGMGVESVISGEVMVDSFVTLWL